MDVPLAIMVLSPFLVVFVAAFGWSTGFRQQEQKGIDRDVESVRQRTVAENLVPVVLDVFEYEPLAYGEDEGELAEKMASALDPGLWTIAKVYKCQDIVRRFGRFFFWSSAVGILLEIVFITLVACLGPCTELFAAVLSASFLVLGLCTSFAYVRSRNIQQAHDMAEQA